MDRNKFRDEEAERELDRKIALIREKNQKIEQRSKEIEEDRARTEETSGKSLKTSQVKKTDSKPVKKGEWSREWDKGKTAAETWNENVPSMDLKDLLAGGQPKQNPRSHPKPAGGCGKSRKDGDKHGGGSKKQREPNCSKTINGLKIPARLEGRITLAKPSGAAEITGNDSRRGGNGGQKGEKKQHKNNQQRRQPKVEPTTPPTNIEKKTSSSAATQPAKKGKNRPRRESDNYAVKKIVRGIIDKICWLERLEKRQAKINNVQAAVEHPTEEVVTKVKVEEEENENEVVDEPMVTKANDETNQKEDANQNVISLVREKTVTIITTQVA